MVLLNYKGYTSKPLEVIHVEVVVWITTQPTLFVVVQNKVNYNLLLGRQWIHGVGIVPLTMHKRITTLKPDGTVENIEANQSYLLADVNHIYRRNFDR